MEIRIFLQSCTTNLYGLRGWVEYGYKQSKQELGWCDFRLTDYKEIERWWEMVFSSYLMVSLQAFELKEEKEREEALQKESQKKGKSKQANSEEKPMVKKANYKEHEWWDSEKGWKRTLKNLRILIQPYIYFCLLTPWLMLLPNPLFTNHFLLLMQQANQFAGFLPK